MYTEYLSSAFVGLSFPVICEYVKLKHFILPPFLVLVVLSFLDASNLDV